MRGPDIVSSDIGSCVLSSSFGVIDLFAGPGGLGEGFSSIVTGERHPFRIGISVEKEESAHRTLRLRAFLREFVRKEGNFPKEYLAFHAGLRPEPDWSQVDAEAWTLACSEARCLELGEAETALVLDSCIDLIRNQHRDTVLIGGPPCQAYSLVGRARARGISGYRAEDDHRHFLFREYVRVLDRLRPAAFVLENVKGVLSSKVGGLPIFDEIMRDIATLGGHEKSAYELFTLTIQNNRLRLARPSRPSDFIVRAERFGIPQRRHRVIVVGIRRELSGAAERASIPAIFADASVEETIGTLAPLRSGVSRAQDDTVRWQAVVLSAALRLADLHMHDEDRDLRDGFLKVADDLRVDDGTERSERRLPLGYGGSNLPLLQWLENDQLMAMAQHETRGHMASDLERYLFASVYGKVRMQCARKSDYPLSLAPNHESWNKGIFSDRFRVQLAHEPSTTITSHISKDGHYFIHPDPKQCRSLTVREAARLQTFPDDYLFLGNRTQQYVQVGNAVPPFLARQIAALLLEILEGSEARGSETRTAQEQLVAA